MDDSTRIGTEVPMSRTRILPLLAAGLAAALLAAGPVIAQRAPTAGNKDALAALDRMIAAMGGRKVLEAVKDVTISGTAEMVQFGITAPVTVYQKQPDKVRVDVTIAEAGMTISQAFDGAKGWFTDPQSGGVVQEMPDHLAREFARQAGENQALLFPQKQGVTYVLKPKAPFEGRDHIVLEQTLADGHKTTYFLDPETSLPAKTATRTIDRTGAEVDAETYASDYRKVAGMTVPYAIRVVQNGAEVQRVTVTAVTVNTALDDALFTLKGKGGLP
jgi:outer membrane lipoprotein-sorting protein